MNLPATRVYISIKTCTTWSLSSGSKPEGRTGKQNTAFQKSYYGGQLYANQKGSRNHLWHPQWPRTQLMASLPSKRCLTPAQWKQSEEFGGFVRRAALWDSIATSAHLLGHTLRVSAEPSGIHTALHRICRHHSTLACLAGRARKAAFAQESAQVNGLCIQLLHLGKGKES